MSPGGAAAIPLEGEPCASTGVEAGRRTDRESAAIVVRTDVPRTAWNEYVQRCPDASMYHLAEWPDLIARVFRHKTRYFAATIGERIVGVLPVVSFDTPLFGRFSTSMPFLNYGGVVADTPEAKDALLAAAVNDVRAGRGRYLELRHRARVFSGLPAQTHKVAMVLPLQTSVDDQWRVLDRKLRNQVRKAEKSGLSTVLGGVELLDAFYDVLAQNMRDLGTPVHSRRFYEEILTTFPSCSRVLCVKLGAIPIAASIVLWHKGQMEVPWASAIRAYNPLCPNVLLYWGMLKFAIGGRCIRFDFGRSTPNEGTFNFKQQWGAESHPLYWECWLAEGSSLPDRSPKNARFSAVISLWRRLPVAVTKAIGPAIVRNIP